MATSVPLQWQKQFPNHATADAWLEEQLKTRLKTTDANDTIYHFRASEDYDPSARLGEIVAPLLAINSADDFVNPPELPMMRAMIGQVKRGTFVLLPISEDTRGHGTHSQPLVFGPYLAEFLKTLAP
jgi:homoserine O-acetyltransferase